MLRFKLLLKMKTILEHVANSNFLTYLGTLNPVFSFVRNHNIADFMITVKYQGWKHLPNVENGSLTHFRIQ